MKLTFLLIFAALLQVSARSSAQITLAKKNSSLLETLKDIRAQSGYSIFYDAKLIKHAEKVSVLLNNVSLEDALKACFLNQPFSYTITQKTIVIVSKPAELKSVSQDIKITGKVTDDKNLPLPGVTIRVKGTKTVAVTNVDGNYTISVPDQKAVLQFSFIGFQPKEVLADRSEINVTLTAGTSKLNEIVVVGYGTQNRTEITTAVSKVRGEDIQNIPVASPEALLQGRVAGVEVIQNSGQPGAGVTVRVRGNTSINAGNTPLYVVDGVPINSDNISSDNRGNEINPLADIPSNDIESIEVLKDASAAAIYGSRAANGVILITTKRGKEGVAAFSVNIYRGSQEISRYLPKLPEGEFIEWTQESRANQGLPAYSFPTLLNDSVNTDWLRAITRIAPILNVDASIRGGSSNLRYSFSANYYDQEGIVKSTEFNRISARFNLDYNANKRFTIGNNILISRTNNDRAVGDDQGNAIIGYALRKAPTVPIYNPDGSYFLNDPIYGGNPVAYFNLQKYTTITTRVVGSVFGEYKILPNLSIKILGGTDYTSLRDDYFRPSSVDLNGLTLGGAGAVSLTTWISENTINYTAKLGKNNNLSVLGGFSQQQSETRSVRATVSGYGSDAIPTINGASIISTATSDIQNNALTSFFARANYSYKSKYLLQISGRADGSSRFGPDNRYAFFPGASIGWRVAEEKFLKDSPVIDELKLRASFGSVGNQNGIPNYGSQGTFATGLNYSGISGIGQTVIANSKLKWEKTATINAGVDLGLFKSRIQITADAYIKKTSDLLLNRVLPGTSGYTSYLANIGNTENRGVELALTTNNFTGVFKWTTNFNISFNRNKIVSLADGQQSILFSRTSLAPPAYLVVGDPIGSFYGWDFLRVLPTDADNTTGLTNSGTYVYKGGDAYYRDVNGDNKIDNADIVKIGDANPKFFGGFTNKFVYKGIDLSIFLQYSYGGDIYNITNQNQRDNVILGNRWRKPGDITDVPRVSSTDQSKISRRFLEDGSYLKIKNITLGYTLNKKLLQALRLKNARIYASGQNLVTFTKYKGFDPEVNSVNPSVINMGLDYFSYPQVRTYMLGLSVGF